MLIWPELSSDMVALGGGILRKKQTCKRKFLEKMCNY